jgi:hypothetical protein
MEFFRDANAEACHSNQSGVGEIATLNSLGLAQSDSLEEEPSQTFNHSNLCEHLQELRSAPSKVPTRMRS